MSWLAPQQESKTEQNATDQKKTEQNFFFADEFSTWRFFSRNI